MSFADLVKRIRTEQALKIEMVPGFDEKNGNERAKYLFLLEAPGREAKRSGSISYDNPDPTARHLKEQLDVAEILREEIAIWNIVPWFIGNEAGTSIRAAKGEDVRAGQEYLPELLLAMPNLRCIVLVGGAAREAHRFLSSKTTARIVTCHHTSRRVLNPRPETRAENIEIFRYIKANI